MGTAEGATIKSESKTKGLRAPGQYRRRFGKFKRDQRAIQPPTPQEASTTFHLTRSHTFSPKTHPYTSQRVPHSTERRFGTPVPNDSASRNKMGLVTTDTYPDTYRACTLPSPLLNHLPHSRPHPHPHVPLRFLCDSCMRFLRGFLRCFIYPSNVRLHEFRVLFRVSIRQRI